MQKDRQIDVGVRPLKMDGTDNTGRNQTNKITVVANGTTLTFFANEQQIGQVQDSTCTGSMIGLIAYPGTEAAYNNAKIWTL